ncbi:MAG: hypothetical protein ACI9YE_001250 [Psychroserpens sp.]|jgi:hypothetical protein
MNLLFYGIGNNQRPIFGDLIFEGFQADTLDEAKSSYKENDIHLSFVWLPNDCVVGGVIDHQSQFIQFIDFVYNETAIGSMIFFTDNEVSPILVNYVNTKLECIEKVADDLFLPLVRFYANGSTNDCAASVVSLGEYLELIRLVDIDSNGSNLFLVSGQKWLLQSFARQYDGVSCNVETLDGGLSNSRVFKLEVKDNSGLSRISAVAKMGNSIECLMEEDNFKKQVTRLPANSYASQIGLYRNISSSMTSVFYRLLKPTDQPLFDFVSANPARAAELINGLKENLNSWAVSSNTERVQVSDVRRIFVDDDQVSLFVEEFDLEWVNEIERIYFHSKFSTVHGDLHPGNIFVSEDVSASLIDFGDIKNAPSVLDPLALELSIFTHPETRKKLEWLPDLENLNWSDLDSYLVGCPFEVFIRACRGWSFSVAGGDKDVYACAYGFLLKQLKYDDVDKDLVLKLLFSIKESLVNH